MKSWRKGGGIDLDRSKGYNNAEYPRQPCKYHMHIHFRQRFKEKERFLTGEIIGRLITCGYMIDNGDGCVRFKWSRRGGVFYYLIAGYHQRGHRIVVTAWPELEQREPALRSDRWTHEKLDILEEFNRKKTEPDNPFKDTWGDYIEWSKAHA